MKTSALLLASTALFGQSLAQQASLPTCAQPCVNSFTSGDSIGDCNQFDIKCICSSSSFLGNIACCLQDSCSTDDQNQAVTYAKQLCTTAGVTVPDTVVCLPSNGTTTTNPSPTDDGDSGAAAAFDRATGAVALLGVVAAAALL